MQSAKRIAARAQSGHAASQQRFAREVARVGRAFWIQTPNRWFPVEQHLLTPFVHWLPKRWQRRIVPRFTVWDALVRPSPDRRGRFRSCCAAPHGVRPR